MPIKDITGDVIGVAQVSIKRVKINKDDINKAIRMLRMRILYFPRKIHNFQLFKEIIISSGREYQ